MSSRDAYFDNAKLVLMVLVILGHVIEPLVQTSASLRTIYLTIYAFHMPAFVLISGYFAKNLATVSVRFRRILERILPPYLVFQVLYYAFQHFAFRTPRFEFSLLTPYWLMWFMLSLAFWQLLGPIVAELRHPMIITACVAVLAGYVDQVGYPLSASRTLVFLPFFVAGYGLDKRHLENLFRPAVKALSVLFIAGVSFLMYRYHPDVRWLYGSYSYAHIGYRQWWVGVIRLSVYGVQALSTASVLSLIPRHRNVLTGLGSRTLYAYLLHGFVVQSAVALGVYNLVIGPSRKAALLVAAPVLCLALSSNLFRVVFRPFVEPRTVLCSVTPLAWLQTSTDSKDHS